MKLKTVLVWLFFYSFVFGQKIDWPTTNLRYNAPSRIHTNYGVLDSAKWFLLSKKSYYLHPTLSVENLSCGKSLKLEFYESPPTDSILPPLLFSQTLTLNISNNTNLDFLQDEKRYYLRVVSPLESVGRFTIFYHGGYEESGCEQEISNINSFRIPSSIVLDKYRTKNCVDDCTKFCHRGKMIFNPLVSATKIKYYKLESNLANELLSITLTCDNSCLIDVIGVNKNTRLLERILSLSSVKSHIDIDYLPIYNYKNIYIAISGKNKGDVSYTMCVEMLPFKSSCVDYDEPGDSIMVIGTSFGSPIEGPFLPGEIITMKYVLNKWVPVHDNWPHSYSFNLTGPWKMYTDTFHLDQTHILDSINAEQGYVWVFSDTSSLFFDKVNFKGAGFYPLSGNYKGPDGFATGWGRRPSYSKYDGLHPLVDLIFKLKVPDSLDCVDTLSCAIRVDAYSDAVAGTFPVEGCTNNFNIREFQIKCCPQPDSLLYSYDNQLCLGDSLTIEFENKGENLYLKKINVNPFEEAFEVESNKVNLSVAPMDIDENNEGQIALFYNTPLAKACYDTIYLGYQVHEKPEIDLINSIETCLGDSIDLQSIFLNSSGKYPRDKYNVSWDGDNVDISDQNEIGVINSRKGKISLSLTDEFGCMNTDSVQITAQGPNISTDIKDTYVICRGKSSVIVSVPFNSATWQTPNGDMIQGNTITATQIGNYTLTIEGAKGCHTTKGFTVSNANIPDTSFVSNCELPVNPGNLQKFLESDIPDDDCKPIIVKKVISKESCDATCQKKIKILPNPTKGAISIVSMFANIVDYTLLDANWKVYQQGVLVPGVNQADISNKFGNMYLYVTSENCKIVKKIIIIN